MNRNFFLLWQGQMVSQMGSQAFAVAMMFWIKHATGSATLMGLVMMASTLPAVFIGPIGGTYVDRVSRRRVIIISDIAAGLSVLSLAGLIFASPGRTDLILVWMFAVAVVLGISGSFLRPAISAAIPDLVPMDKVAGANSLQQFSFQFSSLVGLGAGGVLFRLLGAPIMFLIDGLTYLFSAFSESFIEIPQKLPEKSGGWRETLAGFRNDLAEGFYFVWRQVGLRILLISCAVMNLFATPVILLLPFYAEDVLKLTPDWYGFLMAAFGLGAIIGFAGAGAVNLSGRMRGRVMLLFLFGQGLGVIGLALLRIPLASLALILVIGIMNGYFNVTFNTVIQVATPSELRGRVFGVNSTLTGGLMPLAMALAGVAADLLDHNIPLIYVCCGAVLLLIMTAASLSREFRRYVSS